MTLTDLYGTQTDIYGTYTESHMGLKLGYMGLIVNKIGLKLKRHLLARKLPHFGDTFERINLVLMSENDVLESVTYLTENCPILMTLLKE